MIIVFADKVKIHERFSLLHSLGQKIDNEVQAREERVFQFAFTQAARKHERFAGQQYRDVLKEKQRSITGCSDVFFKEIQKYILPFHLFKLRL